MMIEIKSFQIPVCSVDIQAHLSHWKQHYHIVVSPNHFRDGHFSKKDFSKCNNIFPDRMPFL